MSIKCDICGFPIIGKQNYCSGCGVDLREQKEDLVGETNTPDIKLQSRPRENKGSTNEIPVINWCWLKWGELQYILVMMALLAKGKSKLGFCECATCNQGYREWLAFSTDPHGTRKLKASSREIVKKAREEDIKKTTLNVAYLINTMASGEQKGTSEDSNASSAPNTRTKKGKILIELDESVIERAIVNVLSSEQGKNFIRNVQSSRKKRTKE